MKKSLYVEDLSIINEFAYLLKNSSILITGATGLIGSFLVDALLYNNEVNKTKIEITGTGRSKERLNKRFSQCGSCKEYLNLVARNATEVIPDDEKYDYIIHLASNADPKNYSLYPAETIITNVLGTLRVLDYAVKHPNVKILYASSYEVYGEIPRKEKLSESDFGEIDFNSIRSGYPESKRVSELLIRSFVDEYSIDAKVARLSSVYGPTMTDSDDKAVAQFIRKAVNSEDIVLKSAGTQKRSYTYVADAVSGILTILCNGETGEAYNVANKFATTSIAELAEITANVAGTKVVYERSSEIERKGYSKTQDSILDTEKLIGLGFSSKYGVREGIERTIRILCNEFKK